MSAGLAISIGLKVKKVNRVAKISQFPWFVNFQSICDSNNPLGTSLKLQWRQTISINYVACSIVSRPRSLLYWKVLSAFLSALKGNELASQEIEIYTRLYHFHFPTTSLRQRLCVTLRSKGNLHTYKDCVMRYPYTSQKPAETRHSTQHRKYYINFGKAAAAATLRCGMLRHIV